MDPEAGRLTWLGHATVLLTLGGRSALTDPLLRRHVMHLARHARDPELPASLDVVLLSHLHRDHVDGPSLRRLPAAPVVVPRGGAGLVRRLGRADVVEISAGETIPAGGLSVTAVEAEHDGRRSPLHPHVPALGYVIERGGLRVFFAGDTDDHEGLHDLGRLDVALLPVSGWGPSLGPGHLDPESAADVAVRLGARLSVPIHWGTYLPVGYGRRRDLLSRPGPAFAEAVRRLDPALPVAVVAPGGSVGLTRPD
jgi:L-ascorbate metabolism protein UlaG (beta-lactamase superfamily)